MLPDSPSYKAGYGPADNLVDHIRSCVFHTSTNTYTRVLEYLKPSHTRFGVFITVNLDPIQEIEWWVGILSQMDVLSQYYSIPLTNTLTRAVNSPMTVLPLFKEFSGQ